jgi:hypothetical protein
MLETLTIESFHSQIGTAFQVLAEDAPETELFLHRVEALNMAASSESGRAPFSLIFTGPAEPAWNQGCFNLQHPSLGLIEGMFLVPIAGDDKHRKYQAIFT